MALICYILNADDIQREDRYTNYLGIHFTSLRFGKKYFESFSLCTKTGNGSMFLCLIMCSYFSFSFCASVQLFFFAELTTRTHLPHEM